MIGSHPGADANAIRYHYPGADIKIVSAFPRHDYNKGFMFKLKNVDADKVEVKQGMYPLVNFDEEKFDLVIIDVSTGEYVEEGQVESRRSCSDHWLTFAPVLKHVLTVH